MIGELLQMVGMAAEYYDVTRLRQDVEGYIINQAITVREAIEQLQVAYFFDVVESEGLLKFIPRVEAQHSLTVDEDELICEASDKSALLVNIKQELELPRKVGISYLDVNANYDINQVVVQRQTVKTHEQVNINVPVVLQHNSAKQIADITLYNAWQERCNYNFTLPARYGYIEPSDIITIRTKDSSYQVRITKTDMNRYGIIKTEAVSFASNNYDFYDYSEQKKQAAELPAAQASTYIELLDLPLLPSGSSNQSTVYVAALGDSKDWKSANIYSTIDPELDYSIMTGVQTQATFGKVSGCLTVSDCTIFDQHSVINVKLLYGELASVSKLALLNGANIAVIGSELVQFKNAELIGEQEYRLSYFLRGRQGTEWATDKHQDGERFLLLTSSVVGVNINSNLIKREIYYKVVTLGSNIAEADEKRFTYQGIKLKPLSPVHLKATKQSDNSTTISWIRRSRLYSDWLDYNDTPLGEVEEKYEIEIKQNNHLFRTLSSETPEIEYTAAAKSEDTARADYSHYEPLTATIYQISGQVGRGYPAVISLPR